jgi:1-phosphatidylinositol-4-phosphate 5-kinase
MSKTEYHFLKKILANYFLHLRNYPDTLLPKFFGCYTLIKKVKKIRTRVPFIVMNNIFSTNKEIHLRYDLKGSVIGRQVLSETKSNIKNKIAYALKDLDLERNKQYFFVGVK